MRIFPASQMNQGSPEWWDIRRGIPTVSEFDRILSPKRFKTGAQAKFLADLCADVGHPAERAPGWLTDRLNKPPNGAVEEGVRREAESRSWLAMERECFVEQVGFVLDDGGMWGGSPDGLIVGDAGTLDGALELKNPQLNTQALRLMTGELPREYVNQCHGHLIVTGLSKCTFLSYCPPLDPLLIDVAADDFTARLREALEAFTKRYLDTLTRLKLLSRFEQQRQSILAHFPEEAPCHP